MSARIPHEPTTEKSSASKFNRAGATIKSGPTEDASNEGVAEISPDDLAGGLDKDIYKYDKLHEIGSIQDQGWLLGIKVDDADKKTIVYASENIIAAVWLGKTNLDDIVDHDIGDVFDAASAFNISNLLNKYKVMGFQDVNTAAPRDYIFQRIMCKGASFSVGEVLISWSIAGFTPDGIHLLEIELVSENTQNLPDHKRIVSAAAIKKIRDADTIVGVTSNFIDQIMDVVPDYDRAMVYQFLDDDCGHVIHENIRPGSKVDSSYLGLRFPATDIPPQARALFLRNGLRFIFDIDGPTIPIRSGSAGAKPLDLTMSCLRSASKCHLDYLRNMGVTSSMTLAINVENKLWGLYVFHSYSKVGKPNVDQRIMLDMVASISATKLEEMLKEHAFRRKEEMSRVLSNLQAINSVPEFVHYFKKDILKVTDTDGLIIFYDNYENRDVFCDANMVPTVEGYNQLAEKCKLNSHFALTDGQVDLFGESRGILCYKMMHALICFLRKPKKADVQWAGHPDDNKDPTVPGRLRPRGSFILYLEKAALNSKIWKVHDFEVAEILFNSFSQFFHSELLAGFRSKLEQSNEECLGAIERAKQNSEFFAHMSHELRTPFHGVMSSLQILYGGNDDMGAPDRKEILECAMECSRTMLRTLDDILTIAKSKNCMDVVSGPMNVNRIVSSTAKIMGPIAENKSITFKQEVGPLVYMNKSMPESEWKNLLVKGDETRIAQICNNLTNNAIKFTPTDGSVRLCVSCLPFADTMSRWETIKGRYAANEVPATPCDQTEADAWVVLEIEDSGVGVSEPDMKIMFNAYQQVSSGVSKTYQGTGLGLHIVRLHSEIMKGMLAVASTPGQGTIFFCAVPVKDLSSGSNGSVEESSKILVPEIERPVNKRVSAYKESTAALEGIFMIVDDSEVNVRLTHRKLKMAFGPEVVFKLAYDGFEAIDAYKAMIEDGTVAQLKGTLMDYHMPKCNGIEAMQGIRQLEKAQGLKHTHIIAFTADLNEKTSVLLLDGGADEVLSKPTLAGELEAKCKRLVEK